MSGHNQPVSPVGQVAPVVVLLFCAIVAVELVFTLAAQGVIGGKTGIGWRLAAVQDWGLPGPLVSWMWENGRWPASELVRLVSYPFVHGNFTQAVFAGAIALALGKFVGDIFSAVSVLVVFFAASIVGGLVWGLLSGDKSYLIGAYPGAYGLIGAFSYILWLRSGQTGESQLKAFQLIGMLLAIQLVLGVFFGIGTTWIAELSGFATGFAVSFLVSPGGFARLRARIQRS